MDKLMAAGISVGTWIVKTVLFIRYGLSNWAGSEVDQSGPNTLASNRRFRAVMTPGPPIVASRSVP